MKRTGWLLPVFDALRAAAGDVPILPAPTAAEGARAEIRGVCVTTNGTMTTMRRSHQVASAMDQLKEMHFRHCFIRWFWNSGATAILPAMVHQGPQDFQVVSYKGLEGQDIIADVISRGAMPKARSRDPCSIRLHCAAILGLWPQNTPPAH